MSNSSSVEQFPAIACIDFTSNYYVLMAVRSAVLVPLCSFVLHLGLQRWRQQGGFRPACHSDLFALHLCVMELLWVVGSLLYGWAVHARSLLWLTLGFCLSGLTIYGGMFFHTLTCVEHYLAVVHPVTYLGLKGPRGARIRNLCLGAVWLLCLVVVGLFSRIGTQHMFIVAVCLFGLSIAVVSFCSVSVLCALIRPGPGRRGGAEERPNQSKQRAFITITAVLCVLLLWLVGLLVVQVLGQSRLRDQAVACVVSFALNWLIMPYSLVSPVLFLHRAGKLPGCRPG